MGQSWPIQASLQTEYCISPFIGMTPLHSSSQQNNIQPIDLENRNPVLHRIWHMIHMHTNTLNA